MSDHTPTPEPSEVAEAGEVGKGVPDIKADRLAAVRRHGYLPEPDDNHTTDGRCKYPKTCRAEPDAGEVEAREWLMQVIGEALMLEPAPDADTVTDAILASDWLAALLDRVRREAKAEGHRAGYETARGDLVSGAFVGGPTYEALRDSFTGKQIVKEALTEAADEMPHTRLAAHWLRDRAARIARSTP